MRDTIVTPDPPRPLRLAQTPSPHEGESPAGWALRVAACNGLALHQILKGAGGPLTTRGVGAGFRAEWLAEATAKRGKALTALNYRHLERFRYGSQQLWVNNFGLAHPKLCVSCVKERPFLQRKWDLVVSQACVEHREWLCSTCSTCGRRLSWFRRDLLVCRCGATLEAPVTSPSNAELALQEVIDASMTSGKSRDVSAFEDTPPLKAIAAGTIESSQLIVRSLAAFSHLKGALPRTQRSMPFRFFFTETAKLLDEWPHRYESLLEDLLNRTKRFERKGVTGRLDDLLAGFRRVHHNVGRFFSHHALGWIYKNWPEIIAPNAKLFEDSHLALEERRWVSVKALARRANVDARHLRKVALQEGRLASPAAPRSASTMVDTDQWRGDNLQRSERLDDRAAGKKARIPVVVLRDLRKTGDFPKTYFGPFHECSFVMREIEMFHQSLRSLAPKPSISKRAEPTVTLGRAMLMHFGSTRAKADIIRGMLAGTVRVAKSSSDITKIEIVASDLRAVAGAGSFRDNGSASIWRASSVIGCDYPVVKTLVEKGFLRTTSGKGPVMVSNDSLQRFLAEWVCLAKLAKPIRTSSQGLARYCKRSGIAVMEISRGAGRTSQPFVRREAAAIIVAEAGRQARHSGRLVPPVV